MGKCTRECAYKNGAFITLVSCEIGLDISLAISHTDSSNKTALGLRMDDSTVRVAVGLRLGTRICGAHTCQHCAAEVSGLGRHSLSCKKSVGRFQRHTALNDIMKYALSAAHVPSRLEPTGLLRSDGKRPDGVTLAPWKCGQLLVWDATCPDTSPLHTGLMQHLSLGVWQHWRRTER